ncbi:hypothetical protein ACFLZ1_05175 [Patescibacteria group bacterium]
MKFLKKIKSINDECFFTHPPSLLRFFTQVYVRGDMIILIPFLLLILFIGFFSIRLMFLTYAVFFTLRQLGEMIYWLLHQFLDKSYRPHDFGFKNLSNEAIYIIYQLLSLVKAVIGISIIIFLIFFI